MMKLMNQISWIGDIDLCSGDTWCTYMVSTPMLSEFKIQDEYGEKWRLENVHYFLWILSLYLGLSGMNLRWIELWLFGEEDCSSVSYTGERAVQICTTWSSSAFHFFLFLIFCLSIYFQSIAHIPFNQKLRE